MEVGLWWTIGGVVISSMDSKRKMQISLAEGFNIVFIGLPVEVLVVVRSIWKWSANIV